MPQLAAGGPDGGAICFAAALTGGTLIRGEQILLLVPHRFRCFWQSAVPYFGTHNDKIGFESGGKTARS